MKLISEVKSTILAGLIRGYLQFLLKKIDY